MGENQNNGNTQLNNDRNNLNQKISKLSFLGKSSKVKWSDKRRYRNI
jgi:hypothetical protein|tara:strand:- start:744 stop:884 length:141 start_codon:yes stop_codon:yes gene_type:complete